MSFDERPSISFKGLTLTRINYALSVLVLVLGIWAVAAVWSGGNGDDTQKPDAPPPIVQEVKDAPPSPPQDNLASVSKPETVRPFGKWNLVCRVDVADSSRCVLRQEVKWEGTSDMALSAELRLHAADQKIVPRLRLISPLGVLLEEGILLSLEGVTPIQVPFVSCTAQGCAANIDMAQDIVDAFAVQENLDVRYVHANAQAGMVALPLDGFAEGLTALEGM